MKAKELKKVVDKSLALHREIAAKTEQLKRLKTQLVKQARLNPETFVPTESGGKRWTATGSDSAIARVSFPAPGIVAEIKPEAEKTVRAIVGDNFRRLFKPLTIYQPAEEFRGRAAALLSKEDNRKLLEICESGIAPRVSFEVARSADNSAE